MTDLNRRSAVRLAVLGASAAGLSACVKAGAASTGLTTAGTAVASAGSTVAKVVAQVPATASEAVLLWGIAKGIAQVGLTVLELSDPGLAATITLALNVGQKAVDSLPGLAGNVEALGDAVSTVFQQTQALLLNAAGSITAVANKA